MKKRDVIETIVGIVCWVITVVLALLTGLGIMDINAVLDFAYCVIVFLCMALVALLMLWLSLKK